jgi:hypothetical protein
MSSPTSSTEEGSAPGEALLSGGHQVVKNRCAQTSQSWHRPGVVAAEQKQHHLLQQGQKQQQRNCMLLKVSHAASEARPAGARKTMGQHEEGGLRNIYSAGVWAAHCGIHCGVASTAYVYDVCAAHPQFFCRAGVWAAHGGVHCEVASTAYVYDSGPHRVAR